MTELECSMTELEAIANSVAKALGLTHRQLAPGESAWGDGSVNYLEFDGSNLFDPYWQVRCRDWLLERGSLHFENSKTFQRHNSFFPHDGDPEIEWLCPTSEFCARAIHALDKQER